MATYHAPRTRWKTAVVPATERALTAWLEQHDDEIVRDVNADLMCRFSAPGDGNVVLMYLVADDREPQ